MSAGSQAQRCSTNTSDSRVNGGHSIHEWPCAGVPAGDAAATTGPTHLVPLGLGGVAVDSGLGLAAEEAKGVNLQGAVEIWGRTANTLGHARSPSHRQEGAGPPLTQTLLQAGGRVDDDVQEAVKTRGLVVWKHEDKVRLEVRLKVKWREEEEAPPTF